jgi:hypothetical protein
MKNSNNLIENRTRDIHDCSAVRKPSAPECTHFFSFRCFYIFLSFAWQSVQHKRRSLNVVSFGLQHSNIYIIIHVTDLQRHEPWKGRKENIISLWEGLVIFRPSFPTATLSLIFRRPIRQHSGTHSMSVTAQRLQLTVIALPFIIASRKSRRHLLWWWRPFDIVMLL